MLRWVSLAAQGTKRRKSSIRSAKTFRKSFETVGHTMPGAGIVGRNHGRNRRRGKPKGSAGVNDSRAFRRRDPVSERGIFFCIRPVTAIASDRLPVRLHLVPPHPLSPATRHPFACLSLLFVSFASSLSAQVLPGSSELPPLPTDYYATEQFSALSIDPVVPGGLSQPQISSLLSQGWTLKELSHNASETYVLFRRSDGSLLWRRGSLSAGLDCVVSSDGAHAIIISNGALTYKRNGEFHFDDQGS